MARRAVDPGLGGAVLLHRMEIRPRRNRSDHSGHPHLYDSGTVPARVAVCRGRRGGTMKRWLRLAVLAMLVALPAFTQVVAQQEPAAPGRGQSVADTLEAIQQARVATRVVFIVAHP